MLQSYKLNILSPTILSLTYSLNSGSVIHRRSQYFAAIKLLDLHLCHEGYISVWTAAEDVLTHETMSIMRLATAPYLCVYARCLTRWRTYDFYEKWEISSL